ncbi:hypothetical protein HOLleu_36519 [Holothuria leucospilota]|uniref:Uncharacterized protein n=1 Tax=Holothuria leucospilota TaxID=206669 RepID=A0A9Q0YJU5_HOLLE|nr:hypothetical protein HOLleu_36519 [Holothuria leucospilota]
MSSVNVWVFKLIILDVSVEYHARDHGIKSPGGSDKQTAQAVQCIVWLIERTDITFESFGQLLQELLEKAVVWYSYGVEKANPPGTITKEFDFKIFLQLHEDRRTKQYLTKFLQKSESKLYFSSVAGADV